MGRCLIAVHRAVGMRVIDAFSEGVQAVAVSADGRFLAASTLRGQSPAATLSASSLAVWDWSTGEPLWWPIDRYPATQLAFSPDGRWLASVGSGKLVVWSLEDPNRKCWDFTDRKVYAGGVGFTADGKHLVSTRRDLPGRLDRWAVPGCREVSGFDFWPAFARLAFSLDGQYIAGVNLDRFELRVATTGGLIGWKRATSGTWRPFASFARDSQAVVFGWGDEFHRMETRSGNVLGRVPVPEMPVRDAAFTGSGQQFGGVDAAGVLRLWNPDVWEVALAYNWGAGPLTCVAFTADGLAGVCGTTRGQLILFDLD